MNITIPEVIVVVEDGAAGPLGPTGPTGPTGPRGEPSFVTGPIGFRGPTGPTGEAGPTGPGGVGPTGPTGSQGERGVPGPTGVAGINGGTGPTGPTGASGPTGLTGATGAQGPTGAAGSVGGAGAQGNPGAPGATGPAGATGPTGATGASGVAGPIGPTGSVGPTGAVGAASTVTGPAGATGPTGAAGTSVTIKGTVANSAALPPTGNTTGDGYITLNTGHLWVWGGSSWTDAGPIVGPTGPTGATGLTGATGSTGAVGPTGSGGLPGVAGPTGAQGATGMTGPTGVTGPTGPQGFVGPTGQQGIQGNPGGTGPTGPVSTTPGPTGPTGPTSTTPGPTGPTGPTGPLASDRRGDATQRVAVPSYFSFTYSNAVGADHSWERMQAAAPFQEIAVVNPSNGPGSSSNSSWVTQVQYARAAGLRVLGYVKTNFTAIAAATVKADIDKYYAWYGVDGILVDECGWEAAKIPYYADLNSYIKAKGGLVVINPATHNVDEGYMAACDIVMNFVGTAATYLAQTFPTWTLKYAANRYWHAVTDVTDITQRDTLLAKTLTNRAGYFYLTTDTAASNPFDSIPADPFWAGMIDSVADGLDQISGDARYFNVSGEPGPVVMTNASKLVTPLTINRTQAAPSPTTDADTFQINYLSDRATWTNEKGNLRTSNKGSPAEDALKIIGAPSISGNHLIVMKDDGTPLVRVGSAGTLIAEAGFRMTTAPAAGRVLTSDASGNGTWQSSGLQVRTTVGKTTAPLAAGASESSTIALAAGYRLFKVTCSAPARVRLYATTAQRDADASRAIGALPAGNHGLVLEFIAGASLLAIDITPALEGHDAKTTPDGAIPIIVTNTGTGSATIAVTFAWIRTE